MGHSSSYQMPEVASGHQLPSNGTNTVSDDHTGEHLAKKRRVEAVPSEPVKQLDLKQQLELAAHSDVNGKVNGHAPYKQTYVVDGVATDKAGEEGLVMIDPALLQEPVQTPLRPKAASQGSRSPRSFSSPNRPVIEQMMSSPYSTLPSPLSANSEAQGRHSSHQFHSRNRLVNQQMAIISREPSPLPPRANAASPGKSSPPRLNFPNLPVYPRAPVGPFEDLFPTLSSFKTTLIPRPAAPPTNTGTHAAVVISCPANLPAEIGTRISTFDDLPPHDYDFAFLLHGYAIPVNFTAVEIIVFLPKLFLNEAIARRFVLNGMQNPEHLAILARHRPGLDITVETIGKYYLDALRPADWRTEHKTYTDVQKQALWQRKKALAKPADWDADAIAMNEVVPDRIGKAGINASAPHSVSFRALMEGVVLPTGHDAADLTRAVKWACSEATARNFPGREFLFPDDLRFVLERTGHAVLNLGGDGHADRECRLRYSTRAGKKKEASKKYNKKKNAAKEETVQETVKETTQEITQENSYETMEETFWEAFEEANLYATQQRASNPTSPPGAAPTASIDLTLPPTRLSFHLTGEPTFYPSHRLLRNFNLATAPTTDLDKLAIIAAAVEFARRPTEWNTAWLIDPDHIATITQRLELEKIWEEQEGERQRQMNDEIVPLREKYGLQAWEEPEGERQRRIDAELAALQEKYGME